MKRPFTDSDHVFNNEPAIQASKWFEKVKILGDGDATFLDTIFLDAVVTATVEILQRNVIGKEGDSTEKA